MKNLSELIAKKMGFEGENRWDTSNQMGLLKTIRCESLERYGMVSFYSLRARIAERIV